MGETNKPLNYLSEHKVKTNMLLCKQLTQSKSKVGCFKTNSEEENIVEKMSNVNSNITSPKKSRHIMRKNLTRGHSDPDSRTTRLSLCCAVTESSSHTPPHSHHFQISNAGNLNGDDETQIVHTKDSGSQTDCNSDAQPKKNLEAINTFVSNKNDIETFMSKEYENEYQCSLGKALSRNTSPVKFADDDDADDDGNVSSASSNSFKLCQNTEVPRRHHCKRLSVDNLVISPPSPTFSARHSSPDSVKSVPHIRDRRRRLSHDTIKENKNNSNALINNLNINNQTQQVSMDSLARQSLLAAQVLHLIPADKARERNFLQGRVGANSMLGPAELDRVLPNREIKIFIGTWNMNGEPPPNELNDFMLPNGLEHIPDIIAVGTQESSPERFDWEVKIQETIGPSHVLFHSSTLGTIHLAIFLRRDLLWYCSVPEESSLSVRPGMAFRTKGAVAIAFILFGTSYLFITSHLTAHQDKVKERIHDVKRIVRSLDLPKNLPLRHRIKSKDVTQNFDCVFWFGDLNFRLAQAREDVLHWVEEYKFPLLVDLKTDQLKKLILDGTCLSTFEEGSITFPPTYKYDVGTQNFDTSSKQRTPAYTDRILYKSKGGILSCVTYSSVPTICTSDHKPVWGVYRGSVRPGIDTIPLSAGLFNREVYLEGIKRRAADLERRELGIADFCLIQ